VSAFDAAVDAALRRLSSGRVARALRPLARFAAYVVSMRADGTADLGTDDESVAGPGGVGGRALLAGLPGCRLDPVGAVRGRLVCEGGSLAAVEVDGYEQDRAANRPIARKGDKVPIATLTASLLGPPTGGLLLVFVPAASPYDPDPTTPIQIALPGASILSGITIGVPYEIAAYIGTGSPEISLRRLPTEEIP